MTKQEHFNHLKRIIEHKENEVIHLPAINKIVEHYSFLYPTSKLSETIRFKYHELSNRLRHGI